MILRVAFLEDEYGDTRSLVNPKAADQIRNAGQFAMNNVWRIDLPAKSWPLTNISFGR